METPKEIKIKQPWYDLAFKSLVVPVACFFVYKTYQKVDQTYELVQAINKQVSVNMNEIQNFKEWKSRVEGTFYVEHYKEPAKKEDEITLAALLNKK